MYRHIHFVAIKSVELLTTAIIVGKVEDNDVIEQVKPFEDDASCEKEIEKVGSSEEVVTGEKEEEMISKHIRSNLNRIVEEAKVVCEKI